MTIYVVHAKKYLCSASLTRAGAEELMAQQIERICKTTHEAELKEDRCYDIKLTMIFLDENPQTLISFDPKGLRLALKGIIAVEVEVAGFKSTYYIHSIELDK